jgi:hypothetical protein
VSPATTAATSRLFQQRREVREDVRIRVESRRQRLQLLDEISQHPDADEGLREQAKVYRERLEAGMERLRA